MSEAKPPVGRSKYTTLPNWDVEQITELIQKRRSIFPRDYTDEQIAKEDIEKILEAAMWAPNHGKTEPWLFKVYSGSAKEQLADMHAELYKAEMPAETYKEDKYRKLKNKPRKASHIIAICMKRGDNPKIPELEEIEAVACAVQNMHLMATALGIGGYWSSGGMVYKDSFREKLQLRENDKCLGLFFLGKVREGEWPSGVRKKRLDEVVEWAE